MAGRRQTGAKILIPLFIAFLGLAPLLNVVSSPQFATFRGVDIVRLIASGMCFGAALTALAIFFVGRRS
jgi:hypothetical protein